MPTRISKFDRSRTHLLTTLVLAGAVAFTGCADPASAPHAAAALRATIAPSILDGNHGGNQHFFFLPPMIPGSEVAPFTGATDPDQNPTVTVCEWTSVDGGSCGATVVQFQRTNGAIVYDPVSERYQVDWKTDQCSSGQCTLDVTKTYRLQVSLAGYEIGHADLDVAANGSQLKNVETGEYVGLVDGRTLPIKFRIEKGAVVVASVTVTPSEASLVVSTPASTQQLTATLRDASGVVIPNRPVDWSTSNGDVAEVDASGLVKAVAAGQATITATSESKTGSATITVKAAGYRIVYDAADPTTLLTQVIIQNTDGSDSHVLTSYNLGGSGIGSMARWFPDGHRMIFQIANPEFGDLYFVDERAVKADPNTLQRVTSNAKLNVGAEFSPRGDRIVFLSTRTGNYEMWSMDFDGKNQTQITHTPGGDSPGSFASDGHRFAFTRNDGFNYEIWVMDFDQQNADGSYAEYKVTSVGGQFSNVKWSPIEDKLLTARGGILYLVDPNQRDQALSALTPIDLHGFPYEALYPEWSPDGKKIMFVSRNEWEIYLVDAQGGVPEKIPTPPNLQKDFPSFDPVP